MGVSASTVSRIENSADADLKYGTILAYMKALGLDFGFDAGVSGTPTTRKKSRHGNLGSTPDHRQFWQRLRPEPPIGGDSSQPWRMKRV